MVAFYCLALVGAASAVGSTRHHHKPRDSDHDGMPNVWERGHGLNPYHRDAKRNPDHDGLVNIAEFRNRTRPHVPDTDHDGLTDGAEVHRFGTSPRSEDSDGDGISDGNDDGNDDGVADEGEDGDDQGFAGTIMSFNAETGLLTFESTLGWPVAGLVTADTHLIWGADCEGPATTADLVEGQDIAEVRFMPMDPEDSRSF